VRRLANQLDLDCDRPPLSDPPLLARSAVHAAMAGNTDVLMGLRNNVFVHVPIGAAIRRKKRMELTGELWTNVLLATGQPRWPPVPELFDEIEDVEADTADVAEHEVAAG
jgi:hypothetical protein